jgi:hypothetical protein
MGLSLKSLATGVGGIIEGVGGIIGIGGDSAAALAADATKQNEANLQVTAEEEAIRAKVNLTEQEQANRATEGKQRAAIGGSGVAMNTGSPLDAMAATYEQDQFKNSVAIFNGEVNVAADQAQQIAQGTQGASSVAAGQSSAIGTDAGIVSLLIDYFK